MAKAYICDRCKAFYTEIAKEYNEALEFEFNSISLNFDGLISSESKKADLCPDCLMSLSQWFENYKEE